MGRARFGFMVAALLALPGAAAAQGCGVAPGLSAAGGLVRYDVSGGTSGAAVGADLGVGAGPLQLTAGYRRILLPGDAADPDVLRGTASLPIVSMAGVELCGVAHAGATRFSLDSDAGTVLAGGIGLTLASSTVDIFQPYLSVRGLGAQSTGTVLGVDVNAHGLSLGVEGGVTAVLGRATVRLAGTFDGFDGGLGVTPYPNQSLELALGFRF